jgi:uncharacterized protein (TIGR03382 family)
MKRALIAGLLLSPLLAVGTARAFCGFYVAGAESELFADATMVVMMREGRTTVLSMQNDYRGPVEDFAMVVPVPVILAEENVKTLKKEVFDRVDRLAAPRLVEYWEQDPCPAAGTGEGTIGLGNMGTIGHGGGGGSGSGYGGGALRVRVEAEFAVGEYDIVILSAEDSGDLDTWLRQNDYSIPDGAGDALAPYVQAGMKFFVAKVDVEKVTFEDGRAVLSPLRVHYQSEDFQLPIRLGMLNSSGTQDLIVHVLARNRRYEAASYDNAFVPTNLEVADGVREDFGGFYAALFDKVLEEHPNAVVTEYAWQATSCDPCPGPVLSESDLMTLGADVAIDTGEDAPEPEAPAPTTTQWTTRVRSGTVEAGEGLSKEIIRRVARRHINELRFCHQSRLAGRPADEANLDVSVELSIDSAGRTGDVRVTAEGHAGLAACIQTAVRRWVFPAPEGDEVRATLPFLFQTQVRGPRGYGLGFGRGGGGGPLFGFVLTRLHYRYGRGELGEDLVMRPAPAVEGGRGVGPANELPTGATPAPANNFQGRYIIRHPWEGPIECENPRRGMWGGPPPEVSAPNETLAATNLGNQERGGVDLATLLKNPLPEIGLSQVGGATAEAQPEPEPEPSEGEEPAAAAEEGDDGCGGCAAADAPTSTSLALLLAAWWLVSVRRRR